MKGKALAIRRISKDIKEINKTPVEGIGISSIENDPMKYVVNIKLMSGPYKDYCVQLLLTFPETYPSKPPKMLIYPDQAIDGSCILLQVQNFISDPDMHGYIPPENKIKQLFDSMKTYSRNFKIVNDQGKIEIIKHTWEKPFPEMFEKKIENEIIEEKKEEGGEEKNDEKIEKEKIRMQQIKDNLTCFMLKLNYIDDPDILLGYPIIQNCVTSNKQKIELYPIPELLTYDGYMAQIGKQDDKLDFYFDIKFKSANKQKK